LGGKSALGNTGKGFGSPNGRSGMAKAQIFSQLIGRSGFNPDRRLVMPDRRNVRQYTGFQSQNRPLNIAQLLLEKSFNQKTINLMQNLTSPNSESP
jgi:hypothetical protein